MRKSELKENNIQDLRKTLLPENLPEKKNYCKKTCVIFLLMSLSSIGTLMSVLYYQKNKCIQNNEHFLCINNNDGSS